MKILPNLIPAVKLYLSLKYLNRFKKQIIESRCIENYEAERSAILNATSTWGKNIKVQSSMSPIIRDTVIFLLAAPHLILFNSALLQKKICKEYHFTAAGFCASEVFSSTVTIRVKRCEQWKKAFSLSIKDSLFLSFRKAREAKEALWEILKKEACGLLQNQACQSFRLRLTVPASFMKQTVAQLKRELKLRLPFTLLFRLPASANMSKTS